MFTPKRISPYCPFKTNQRLAFWLLDVMHTTEFFEKFGAVDSAVWCTLQSLTPQWEAHRRAPESDSMVGCTPQSWTTQMHTTESSFACQVHQISCFFVFLCSLHLSTTFYKKTSEVKRFLKQFLTNSIIFILNIFRHKREIAFVKLWIKTNTW